MRNTKTTAAKTPGRLPDEWCTINEAAEYARVGRHTIYRWRDKGWIESRKLASGGVRIKRDSLVEFVSGETRAAG